jgi:hypothetical protein
MPTIHHGAGVGALFGGTDFTFTGPTAPGNATFTQAPFVQLVDSSFTPGDGSFSVNINGTPSDYPSVQSRSFEWMGDNGVMYLYLDAYTGYSGPGGAPYFSGVVAVTPASDFAPGATVQLDGVDRVAMFATGPADAMDPSLVGMAVTGSVTFTSGLLDTGGTVTGAVMGDFGQVEYVDGSNGMIVAGSYQLKFLNESNVYCNGALIGHESEFAGIQAAGLGLTGGPVTVTVPSTTSATVAGAPITSAFGTSPLTLNLQDGSSNLFAGFASASGSGPAGTALVDKYIAFDQSVSRATYITASFGAAYASSDGQSTCSVSFGAALDAM